MINIIICDDDKKIIDKINQEIKENIKFEKSIYSYYSFTEGFKSYIATNTIPTIYILDIDLNSRDINGFYIAKKIRQMRNYNDEIIFFTSYDKYIHNLIGSLIRPVSYIIKSCYGNNLIEAINTASSFIELINKDKDNDTGEIAICEFKVDYRLKFKDILYIEKIKGNKYITIKTKQNLTKNEFKILYNIGSIKNRLDDRFCWLNRGVIINRDYIKYVDVKSNTIGLESRDVLIGTSDNIKILSTYINEKDVVLNNE